MKKYIGEPLKLIEAIHIKQGRLDLPDCSRNDLPSFFKEMGFQTGAEIGVFKGRFTEKFIRQGLKMFAIDAWQPYWVGSEKVGWKKDTKELQEHFYKVAQWRLSRYSECTIIRKLSMDAVKDFIDGSLDFVYIDGNHSFRFIADDIYEWTKKVRKGGIVSGHDYMTTDEWECHVPYVLEAYVKSFGIKNWYVLGGDVDRVRSWMFVNE